MSRRRVLTARGRFVVELVACALLLVGAYSIPLLLGACLDLWR